MNQGSKKKCFSFIGEDIITGKNPLHYLCKSNGLGIIKIVVNHAPFLTMMFDGSLKLPEQYIDRQFPLCLKTVTGVFRFVYLMFLFKDRRFTLDSLSDNEDLCFVPSDMNRAPFKRLPVKSELLDLSASAVMKWGPSVTDQRALLENFRTQNISKLKHYMAQIAAFPRFRQKVALVESLVTTLDDPNTAAKSPNKISLYLDDFSRIKQIMDLLRPIFLVLKIFKDRVKAFPNEYEIHTKVVREVFLPSISKSMGRLVDFMKTNFSHRYSVFLPRLCEFLVECQPLCDVSLVRDLSLALLHRKFSYGESIAEVKHTLGCICFLF